MSIFLFTSHDLFSDISANKRFSMLAEEELANLRGKTQDQNTSKITKKKWLNAATNGKCRVTKRES